MSGVILFKFGVDILKNFFVFVRHSSTMYNILHNKKLIGSLHSENSLTSEL